MADFTVPAGDNVTINGTLTGLGNISGFTITMAAKKTDNPTAVALFTKTATIVNGAAGTFTFSLTSGNTNLAEQNYYYDIKVVDGSGNIRHTAKSTFEITGVITS